MGTSYIGEYPPLKCRSTTEMNKMDKIIYIDRNKKWEKSEILRIARITDLEKRYTLMYNYLEGVE